MPLFEYLCESCGRTFEVIQNFSEAKLTICDRCGGKLKKLVSSPAFQFKGSGWYVSDYGRPDGSRQSEDEGSRKDEGSKEDQGSKKDKGSKKDESSKKDRGSKKGEGSKKDEATSKESAPAGGSTPPPSGKDV